MLKGPEYSGYIAEINKAIKGPANSGDIKSKINGTRKFWINIS